MATFLFYFLRILNAFKCTGLWLCCLSVSQTQVHISLTMFLISSLEGHNISWQHWHCWDETAISKQVVRTSACVLRVCCPQLQRLLGLDTAVEHRGIFICLKELKQDCIQHLTNFKYANWKILRGKKRACFDCQTTSVIKIRCYFEHYIGSESVWYC